MFNQLDYFDFIAFDFYQTGYHNKTSRDSFTPNEIIRMAIRAGLQIIVLPIRYAESAHHKFFHDELEQSQLRIVYQIDSDEAHVLPPLEDLKSNIRANDSVCLAIDDERLSKPATRNLMRMLIYRFQGIRKLSRIVVRGWHGEKLNRLESEFPAELTELVFPYPRQLSTGADLQRIVRYLETLNVNNLHQYSLVAPPVYDPKLHTGTRTEIIYDHSDHSQHDIAVIIPLYNKANIVQDVVRCLVNQTLPKERFELIFVDDGSQDDTANRLLSILHSISPAVNVRVIRRTREIKHRRGQFSFTTGAARNEGIALAEAELLLFLDGDMLAANNLLEAHLSTHNFYPGSVAMGSRTKLKQGSEISCIADGLIQGIDPSPSCFIAEDKGSIRDLLDSGFDWNKIDKYPWLTCASSNVSIPISALRRTGYFDPLGTLWALDDTDLFYRLYRTGFSYVYAKEAAGFHCWHPSEGSQVTGGREELFRLKTSIMFRKYLNIEILKANAYLFPDEFDYFANL